MKTIYGTSICFFGLRIPIPVQKCMIYLQFLKPLYLMDVDMVKFQEKKICIIYRTVSDCSNNTLIRHSNRLTCQYCVYSSSVPVSE
jgi:ribosomal protein S27AE